VAVNILTNIVIQSINTNTGLPFVTNVVATNTIYVMPYGSNSFNDTASMSGNFSGSTQNKYPNQTFTAQGTLIQQQLYPQVVDTGEGTVPVQMAANVSIPITVQGVRVSDTYSSFNTISNSVPYSQTTYSITNFASF
jgi:3-methyladenine DNA glycosylase AlkC